MKEHLVVFPFSDPRLLHHDLDLVTPSPTSFLDDRQFVGAITSYSPHIQGRVQVDESPTNRGYMISLLARHYDAPDDDATDNGSACHAAHWSSG